MFQNIKFILEDFYINIEIQENKLRSRKKTLEIVNHLLLLSSLIMISLIIYKKDWHQEYTLGLYFTLIGGGYFYLLTNKKFMKFWAHSRFAWIVLVILIILTLIYIMQNLY